MSSSQPESGSNGGLSPYVQMLLSFETVPEWHNLLSTLLIWMITAGFIIIPSARIGLSRTISSDHPSVDFQILELNGPLFTLGISMVFVGLIGMFVLSRYRYPNQIPLKDNYFWLYHRYYLCVFEGGIYGVISLLVTIFKFPQIGIPPIIAAICVTCSIKVVFSGLTGWSYLKMRQVKMKNKASQPQQEKPQTEDPYVQILHGFGTLPGWHNLLSTLFICLMITGFITVPPAMISFSQKSSGGNNNSLQLQVHTVLNKPLFAIGISMVFVGLIGMFVLSRYRYLKDNHFWLYHSYYRPIAEGGIYGMISLLVSILVVSNNNVGPAMIAVICVTCVITALFSGLAGRSYFKMRQARKVFLAHLKTEPRSEEAHFSGSP